MTVLYAILFVAAAVLYNYVLLPALGEYSQRKERERAAARLEEHRRAQAAMEAARAQKESIQKEPAQMIRPLAPAEQKAKPEKIQDKPPQPSDRTSPPLPPEKPNVKLAEPSRPVQPAAEKEEKPARCVIGNGQIDSTEMQSGMRSTDMVLKFSDFEEIPGPRTTFERFVQFFSQFGVSVSKIIVQYVQEDNYYHADPIFPAEFEDYEDYEKNYGERRPSACAEIQSIAFRMRFPHFDNAKVICNLHFSYGYYHRENRLVIWLCYLDSNHGDPMVFFDRVMDKLKVKP